MGRRVVVTGFTIAALSAIVALAGSGCGVNQRRVVVKREAVKGLSSPDWNIQSAPAEAIPPAAAPPATSDKKP